MNGNWSPDLCLWCGRCAWDAAWRRRGRTRRQRAAPPCRYPRGWLWGCDRGWHDATWSRERGRGMRCRRRRCRESSGNHSLRQQHRGGCGPDAIRAYGRLWWRGRCREGASPPMRWRHSLYPSRMWKGWWTARTMLLGPNDNQWWMSRQP